MKKGSPLYNLKVVGFVAVKKGSPLMQEITNEAAVIAVTGLLACGLLCICAFKQRRWTRPTRCRCIMHEECPHIPRRPCPRCQYDMCRQCLDIEGLCCSCRTCRR